MTACFGCSTTPAPDRPLTVVDERLGSSYGGATIWACDGCAPRYTGDLPGLQILARVRGG